MRLELINQYTRYGLLLSSLGLLAPNAIAKEGARYDRDAPYAVGFEQGTRRQILYRVTAEGDAVAFIDIIIGRHRVIQNEGIQASERGRYWPDNIVYYSLARATRSTRKMFRKAIAHIEDYTALRFVERTPQNQSVSVDYIDVVTSEDRRWCRGLSPLGRVGGAQKLQISARCEDRGTLLHALMHALGFWHQYQRQDRDQHVFVPSPGSLDYEIREEIDTTSPYDYASITHSDDDVTMLDPDKQAVNGLQSLSAGDIAALNAAYPRSEHLPPGYVRLISLQGELCLTVQGGEEEGAGLAEEQNEHRVRVRRCRLHVSRQSWAHRPDETIINKAYPNYCLGKAITLRATPKRDPELASYPVTLQACNGKEEQKWLFKSGKFRNKANQRLVLMQSGGLRGDGLRGVGAVADPLPEEPVVNKQRYLWDWR